MRLEFNSAKTQREYIPAEKLTIRELKNCTLKDGKIENRKGFVANPNSIILKQYGFTDGEKSFSITENFLFIDGQYGRVAVDMLDNLMGTVTYSLLFLTAGGDKRTLGYIEFTSGHPDSFTVFLGAKTIGSGIYFMSRLCYKDGRDDFVSIRELTEDHRFWVLLPEEKLYTPTLLANGRGESYHFATVGEKELRLPEPVLPQAKNMLTPRFKARYTTDGSSSAFSLPFAEIDSSAVSAELDLKGEKYSFFIAEGSSASAQVKIGAESTTMHIDRISGRISFKCGENVTYAPAFTGEYNNLTVTASKTEAQDKILASSFTACQKIEGSVPAGKNEITLFYGNKLMPAMVLANSPESPLYFSKKVVYSLGNPEKGVLHIADMGGKVFAFKEGKAFIGEIKLSEKEVGTSLQFFEGVISFKGQSEIPLCPRPETVRAQGGSILLQSEDNSVWEITLGANSTVSAKRIEGNTEQADFAITLEDKYLLIKDKTATVFWKNGGEYVMGRWSLPARATGGLSYLEKTAVFFEYKDDLVYIMFPASYKGDEDIFLLSEQTVGRSRVDSSVLIDLTDRGIKPLRLYKISALLTGKCAKLCLWAEGKRVAERKARLKNGFADFYVGAAAKNILAEISFVGQGVISGIITEYKYISKK